MIIYIIEFQQSTNIRGYAFQYDFHGIYMQLCTFTEIHTQITKSKHAEETMERDFPQELESVYNLKVVMKDEEIR